MRRTSRHISYANVTASLAVFLALGGISWAATTLPRNSVGAKQIKTSAVGSSEVKDQSLKAHDFAPGTLTQGPQGPQGVPGPKGAPGAAGEKGDPGTARAFAFVDPNCDGLYGKCPLTNAKNIVSAHRDGDGVYCVRLAPGIASAKSGAAAGVEMWRTEAPEGNATAMAFSLLQGPCDDPSDVLVVTERIPQNAPVVNGKAQVVADPANNVAFWLLIP
jgi:hypothetical protein